MIGMDFGTTNSGIATYDGQRLQLIPIDASSDGSGGSAIARTGSPITRTALYITNDRQVYIGREAIDTYFTQNLNRPVNISRVRIGEIKLVFAELPAFFRDVYVDK